MQTVMELVVLMTVVIIISFGTGLILGGPEKGQRIVAWELRTLLKVGRRFLKLVFRVVSDVFKWASNQL